ncbi:hypothetical protein [Nocardia fusca]|uniref:YubB ferredoxin-like domain-containing protein n=1 Tax=Nocardia fusca TaxID=941183 RepID=A0ABV3FFU6_9NOCA
MPQLRLLPEIQCWPTWVQNGNSLENVKPTDLPISSDLAEALVRWSDKWDATYNLVDDPGNPAFLSADDELEFWCEGDCFARKLGDELGSEWAVEYDSKYQLPPGERG